MEHSASYRPMVGTSVVIRAEWLRWAGQETEPLANLQAKNFGKFHFTALENQICIQSCHLFLQIHHKGGSFVYPIQNPYKFAFARNTSVNKLKIFFANHGAKSRVACAVKETGD